MFLTWSFLFQTTSHSTMPVLGYRSVHQPSMKSIKCWEKNRRTGSQRLLQSYLDCNEAVHQFQLHVMFWFAEIYWVYRAVYRIFLQPVQVQQISSERQNWTQKAANNLLCSSDHIWKTNPSLPQISHCLHTHTTTHTHTHTPVGQRDVSWNCKKVSLIVFGLIKSYNFFSDS